MSFWGGRHPKWLYGTRSMADEESFLHAGTAFFVSTPTRIWRSGRPREKRFFGRRGFNQPIGKYVLFRHQTTASRSLRMTCKNQLSDHDAGSKIHPQSSQVGYKSTPCWHQTNWPKFKTLKRNCRFPLWLLMHENGCMKMDAWKRC